MVIQSNADQDQVNRAVNAGVAALITQNGGKHTDGKPLYFEDPFMDLAFLHTLTLHGFKGSELGECYYAAALINDGDSLSWFEAWSKLSEKVERLASSAEAKGHRVSAREAYLRAVTYLRNVALALRPSDPRYRATIEHSRVLFGKFAALSVPAIEVVEIPYEGKILPGYFLRSDARGERRPTIVIGDNTSEELYYWVGPPAVERGYNALLVDLPGIGLNHFNGIESRADTEVPVMAVVDYLCSRSDVDAGRIAVYGGGEGGGYIMTRAAAHEHRIAACVVDPLVYDMEPIAPLFMAHVLPASANKDSLGAIGGEILKLIWGFTGPEALKAMKADTAQITCPTLCLNESGDATELIEQARYAVAHISNSTKALRLFTHEDATGGYRQLDNFSLKHQVMFDWLDDVFGL
ncbi:MAG: hypothetical protein WBR28_02460 [Mycobacterium sp.]